ncbi:MAG TPA: hypothetical protein VKO18_18135 [Terriglobia bacterium]|nr:hypothetical protein [Terriglobia bacterium]
MGPEDFQLIDDSRLRVPRTGMGAAFPHLASLWLAMFGICFTLCFLLARPTGAAQALEFGKEAQMDPHGNIYVSSDEGKLIKVTDTSHCSESIFAPDRQTFGCRVKGPLQPNGYWESLILEIYRKGGQRTNIQPGAPIGEWHFWKDGQEVSVCSYPSGGTEMHILYNAATGQVVEKAADDSSCRW